MKMATDYFKTLSRKQVVLFLIVVLHSGCIFSDQTDEANLQLLARANNKLALSFYKEFASSSRQNIFFSPLSLFVAFGILYKVTGGSTAQEMRNFLNYPLTGMSDESIQSALRHLSTQVLNAPKNYTLNSANSILVDKSVNLIPSFKREVENQFLAKITEVDFMRNTDWIVRDINNWVKTNTKGKIPHLLDDLDQDTVMAIFNAVYFKGMWKKAFKSEVTRSSPFYNEGKESLQKSVPMMHTSGQQLVAFQSTYTALELPYIGDEISMLILLPKQYNGLDNLVRSLTLGTISSIQSALRSWDTDVWLPRFNIESSFELNQFLQRMGLREIFWSGADFSGGMVSDRPMFVSRVLHKAVVEVNEEGTEAAAVTGSLIRAVSATPSFRADHPFMFFIIDKRSGWILFAGRVNHL